MKIKLSILIPAYNEANTIHLILDKVKAAIFPEGVSKEILIVNDCSSDNSVEKIEEYKLKKTWEKELQFTRQLNSQQAII